MTLVGRSNPHLIGLSADFYEIDFASAGDHEFVGIAEKKFDFMFHLALLSNRSVGDFFPGENSRLVSKLSEAIEKNGGTFVLLSSVVASFPELSNYARARWEMEKCLEKGNASVFRIGLIPASNLDPAINRIASLARRFRVVPVPKGKVFVTTQRDLDDAIRFGLKGESTGTHTFVSGYEELGQVVEEVLKAERIRSVIVPSPNAIIRLVVGIIDKVSSFLGRSTRLTLSALNYLDLATKSPDVLLSTRRKRSDNYET